MRETKILIITSLIMVVFHAALFICCITTKTYGIPLVVYCGCSILWLISCIINTRNLYYK